MLYAPPARINAEVFACLPEALRTGTPDNEWVRGQPYGMPHQSMLEGPSFDRAGNLWCVDILNGRILRVSPDGIFSVVAEYFGKCLFDAEVDADGGAVDNDSIDDGHGGAASHFGGHVRAVGGGVAVLD